MIISERLEILLWVNVSLLVFNDEVSLKLKGSSIGNNRASVYFIAIAERF